MKAKTQKHTPSPDELRLVLSTGGGANIKDGLGNVAVARIFPTEGWEQRASLYLAAPDLLEVAKIAKLVCALSGTDDLQGKVELQTAILALRPKAGAAIAKAEGGS